jgi:surface polysaccharide O-acyltransferase-like enzyme
MSPTPSKTDAVSMRALTASFSTARRLAEQTPEDRNRAVDFLRAVSILVVVVGHWVMAAPQVVGGELRMTGIVGSSTTIQALTWLLQVMPVFFFVGGYANAAGWRAARRDSTPYAVWLRDRLRRLVLPAVPVLAFWVPVATMAWRSGVDADLIAVATQAALVPTWFLATYVVIVAMTPLTLAAWERFGWPAFFAMTAAAALVDVVSLGLGVSAAQWINYVFVWNAVHLLGYAWADARIGGVRMRLSLSLIGLTVLSALVAFGPYPLAMVGLDNAAVTNSNPPKVTLVALALFQFGLAMAAEGPLRRKLADVRPWTAVVAINGSIMSLYLWHLSVMIAVLAGLLALDGFGLALSPGGLGWWISRPLWVGLLMMLTLPVLAVVGRFERPARDDRAAPGVWQPLLAVGAVAVGLGLLAKDGMVDDQGLRGLATALPVIGLMAGGVYRFRPNRS